MKTAVPCPWCQQPLGIVFFFKATDPGNLACPACGRGFKGIFPGFGILAGVSFTAFFPVVYILWSALALGELGCGPGTLTLLAGLVLVLGELAFTLGFMNLSRFERLPSSAEPAPRSGDSQGASNSAQGTERSWGKRIGDFSRAVLVWVYLGTGLAFFGLLGMSFGFERLEIFEFAYPIEVNNQTSQQITVFEFSPRSGNTWVLDATGFPLAPCRVVPPLSSVGWRREGLLPKERGFAGFVDDGQGGMRMAFKPGKVSTGTTVVSFVQDDFATSTTPLEAQLRPRPVFFLFLGTVFSIIGILFLVLGDVSQERQLWFGIIISLSLALIAYDLQFYLRFCARFGFSSFWG